MARKEVLKANLVKEQRSEITEYLVYKKLAELEKGKNRKIFQEIAEDESRHYNFWKKYTNQDVKENTIKIIFYTLLSRIFGITFAIKLMEKKEKIIQERYRKMMREIPQTRSIIADEKKHETRLINLIDEERLRYVSAMVLGLNDALVELTGVLAGLTFALSKTKLIALTGLITGIAASLSMAASEYLSTKAEKAEETKIIKKHEKTKSPIKASIYTGFMYLITVILLVLPYFIFRNVYLALSVTILIVISAISLFTFYISIAKNLSFKKRFFEMLIISLGVAVITFIIGLLVKMLIGIEV